jgi:hypothetical protein
MIKETSMMRATTRKNSWVSNGILCPVALAIAQSKRTATVERPAAVINIILIILMVMPGICHGIPNISNRSRINQR